MPSTRPRPGSLLSSVISKRSPLPFSTSAWRPRTPWRIQSGRTFASAGADELFGTVPVISADAAITFFLSFLLEPIDGLSDTSKLHIWLGLRALDPVEAIGQRGELTIGVATSAFDVRLERG